MKKLFSIVLSTLLILTPATALANSAQRYWSGVSPTGTMVTGEQSPLVVEGERLTFDLQEFPLEYYSDLEEYLAYTGKVTAEYTFHNPADYDVAVKLAFPFGQTPDYGYRYNQETDQEVFGADGEKYDVMVNGEVVDKTIRHTLLYRGERFTLEKDLPKLMDRYAEDDFWSFDLPVTKYTYTINGIDEEEFQAARLGFRWNGDGTKTKLLLVDQCGGNSSEKSISVTCWVANGQEIVLYAFGEPLQEELEWFSENGSDYTPFDYSLKQVSVETATFEDFVFAEYEDSSTVMRTDWYNAMVENLRNCEWDFGILGNFEYEGIDISDALLRWYEYEITVPAGETIVNTVTAPMYPSVDLDYEPPVYAYTYLLSPAQTWAAFGTLDILVNTPYYMTERGEEVDFEKTENGYVASLGSLPNGELEFTLSTEETPQGKPHSTFGVGIRLILAAAAVIVVVRLQGRKKEQ